MIQKRNCILVYSDMNTWIDFCILVSDKYFNKAMEVTAKAYDDWWKLPDAQFYRLQSILETVWKITELNLMCILIMMRRTIDMTKKTETVIRKYKALSEKEKYDFLKALDEMGGIETFTVGMQIDEFIKFMEEEEDN